MQSSLLIALAMLLLPGRTISGISNRNLHQPAAGARLVQMTQHNKIRVFNHHTYEVIDTAYFIIYHGSKTVEKIPNKGQMTVEQYYFSKTLTDDIYELSIENLEEIFPGNIRFHYAIEQVFRSDKALMAYDKYLKEYKVKYLFSLSLAK